jgi:hypothetical protein
LILNNYHFLSVSGQLAFPRSHGHTRAQLLHPQRGAHHLEEPEAAGKQCLFSLFGFHLFIYFLLITRDK